jgi:hypothetical protein
MTPEILTPDKENETRDRQRGLFQGPPESFNLECIL